jgi:hypothetical protein
VGASNAIGGKNLFDGENAADNRNVVESGVGWSALVPGSIWGCGMDALGGVWGLIAICNGTRLAVAGRAVVETWTWKGVVELAARMIGWGLQCMWLRLERLSR